jgi:hypothetical protein
MGKTIAGWSELALFDMCIRGLHQTWLDRLFTIWESKSEAQNSDYQS